MIGGNGGRGKRWRAAPRRRFRGCSSVHAWHLPLLVQAALLSLVLAFVLLSPVEGAGIRKLDQSIVFPQPPAAQVGGQPLGLRAAATSKLAVRYASSNPAVAEVRGGWLVPLRPGVATITARQGGSGRFKAAPPVARTVTVRPRTPGPQPPVPAMITVQGGVLPPASELTGTAVATFLIANCEVTLEEWQRVRAWGVAHGYTDLPAGAGSAARHPVHDVDWYDAVKWCNARSEMEGLSPVYQLRGGVYRTGEGEPSLISAANGYRLPLEAEWEWAARGGVVSRGYVYSGGNDVNAVAIHWDNCGGVVPSIMTSGGTGRGTWPVGSKAANELGIHDMSGNLYEWVGEQNSGWLSPGPGWFRGGSWRNPFNNCLLHIRGWVDPVQRVNSFGFRVARNAP